MNIFRKLKQGRKVRTESKRHPCPPLLYLIPLTKTNPGHGLWCNLKTPTHT